MTKPTWLKILMGVGAGTTVAVAALSAGTVPALLAGVSAAVSTIAGLYHQAPAPKTKHEGDEP